jgi:hypothetical protein
MVFFAWVDKPICLDDKTVLSLINPTHPPFVHSTVLNSDMDVEVRTIPCL